MKKEKLLLVAAMALFATSALAATTSGQIAARQANFKAIARANKAINDELKKPAPSIKLLRANAAALEAAAGKVTMNFGKGTGAESGVKTAAQPAVWLKNSEFRGEAAKLQRATKALRSAAAGGKVDAVRAAMTTVGASCKSCHSTFRTKD